MAVVFDAKTTTWTNSTVATMTVNNLTVGTGSNRAIAVLLICGSQAVSFPAGLTLTWDSGGTNQALTQISGTLAANGPSSAVAAVYGLLNPTSGNKNLVISWTGNNEMHASAASFTGVDQTSIAVAFPNGNSHSVSTAGASPCTVTVTSATGNMTIAGHAQSSFVWTTLSGTTIATDAVAGPNLGVASNFDNGAATVTLTAAWASGTTPNISVGCDILAAAAGGAAPFFQTDWPNPRPLRYFNSNIWQETGNSSLPIPLTPQGQPFSQDLTQARWPNVRPLDWYRSWEESGNSLTTITTQVVSEFNWQLPYSFIPSVQTWTWNQTIKMGTPKAPFQNYDWPNPPGITWYRNWQEAGNVQLPFPTPFRPFDWPNPKSLYWYRDWYQSPAQPIPQTPFFQSDWPLPKILTWDRFWSQSPYQPLPQTPFFQSDWPLPRTYSPIQQFWAESGNVQLPFPTPFFQIVDAPLRPVAQPIDQTWIQNLLETFLFVPFPFTQSDWPNPRAAQQPILIWTNSLPPGVVGVHGTPTSQHDWPLPKTNPPIDQFWFVSTSNLPIPSPPPPPQEFFGSKTWTNEEWTRKLTEYTRARQHLSLSQQARNLANTRWKK